MRQQFFRRSLQCKRKIALAPRRIDEITDLLFVQIRQRRIRVLGRIEGKYPDDLLVFQITDQRGINRRPQFVDVGKRFADDLLFRFGDQHRLPRIPFDGFADEHQPGLVQLRGPVVLPFRRRNAAGVHVPVFPSENPQINIGAFHLLQIHGLRRRGLRGRFLENKRFEEFPEQSIAADIRAQHCSFFGKFTLYAADENSDRCHHPPYDFVIYNPL